jgi:uncharacterized protein YjaZ
MKKISIITFIIFNSIVNGIAQSKFFDNPDSARFVTADIENFWRAFDDFKRDSTVNHFGAKYIDIGGPGVQGFLPYRIQNAEHLFATVKKHQLDYEAVKANTLKVKEKEKQCRSTFYALKYLYPAAKFPPVYFVIGAYNSGGTSNSNGLFIGAEMQTNIDNIPYLVAHELIHFQQKFPDNPTLLQQTVLEGSADFIGELISGAQINENANRYGELHKDQLLKEFVSKMDGHAFEDWLYGTSKKDDRPNDLGYWIGYQICKSYYVKATDKKKAIADILNIKDYSAFLKQSGFLDGYIKQESR